MSELRVRNMDDWVITELKARARGHGQSLEAELRDRLRELALRPRREMADRAARLRDAIAQEHGLLPDSAAAIREDRDARMIVVDASIAAKWYLNEPGSGEAAALLTSTALLIAPALIRVEVTGAILRRYREGKLSLERAREACDLWDADLAGGALRLVPDDSLIVPARVLAFQIRHAIQDCLYLAAAVDAGRARLVTADPTFHARAAAAFPFIDLQASSRTQ